MDIRPYVEAWIKGMLSDTPLDTIEQFMDENVVFQEFGLIRRDAVGKAARRAEAGKLFMHGDVRDVQLLNTLVDGPRAMVELRAVFEQFGIGEHILRIVFLQTWRDGKIIEQRNYGVLEDQALVPVPAA